MLVSLMLVALLVSRCYAIFSGVASMFRLGLNFIVSRSLQAENASLYAISYVAWMLDRSICLIFLQESNALVMFIL